MRLNTPFNKLRPQRGLRRMLQIMWRDTQALLREFRGPLLGFLVATIGLGILYGELMVIGGHERMPFFQLPYVMFALMILETPIDIPTEPYLLVFWYIMPPIALFIFGRGVSDFARLFFDRSGRRAAWQEAIISTMRQHTIILGVGHVGLKVTQALVSMGFEVVAVDTDISSEDEEILRELGVPFIIGDGRSALTLEMAGIASADALIVCTSQDTINLEMVLRARDLNPALRIVARMGDTQFAEQMKNFLGVSAVLSSADIAAPSFASAAVGVEVTQTVSIHNRSYGMFRLIVAHNSYYAGRSIGSIQDRYDVDIVLHARDTAADVHPDNSIPVEAGDTLVIFAQLEKIRELSTLNRINARR